MNIQAIKAKLYDLQGHVCDGRFSMRSDGRRDPGNKSCSGCARIAELQNQLREALKGKSE